jgi:hypothetical protein
MKKKFRWILVVVSLFLLLVAACILKIVSMHGGHITVSKETTYLTGPVRPDGSIDYLAGVNQRTSEGVTPENNASVLFWQALGPKDIGGPSRHKFFEMMGMAVPPDVGHYFSPSDHLLEQLRDEINAKAESGSATSPLIASGAEGMEPAMAIFEAAMQRPWKRTDCPLMGEWLDDNDKPLALVVEGTRRPRCYSPLFCAGEGDGLLLCALLPGPQHFRDFARALKMRAMLFLGEDRVEDAWNDLMSCHRLARLAAQGPTMIEMFVGATIDDIACDGDLILLQNTHLNAEQLGKMRADLDQLSPLPQMADKIDFCERLMYLDVASDIARNGMGSIGEIANSRRKTMEESTVSTAKTLGLMLSSTIDWNLVLRNGNKTFDQYAEAFRTSPRADRVEAMKKVDDDLRAQASTTRHWSGTLGSAILSPRRTVSEWTSNVLLSLFTATISVAVRVEDRWAMTVALDKLAFAMAAYRVDHGSYPEKLDALVPQYVSEVPKDIFNHDADLMYRLEADGYVMYSVGPNGKDDDGMTVDDGMKNGRPGDWDDITIRIPKKAEKKPEATETKENASAKPEDVKPTNENPESGKPETTKPAEGTPGEVKPENKTSAATSSPSEANTVAPPAENSTTENQPPTIPPTVKPPESPEPIIPSTNQ